MWKETFTRFSIAQTEWRRLTCGLAAPRFMSVSWLPSESTRSALRTRRWIWGALKGPMWIPMCSGWSIGKTPLPSGVVTTGAPSFSASRSRSRSARSRNSSTPPITIGRFATRSRATVSATASASLRSSEPGRGKLPSHSMICLGTEISRSTMSRWISR